MPSIISCSFFITPKAFQALIAELIEDSGFLLAGRSNNNLDDALSEVDIAVLGEGDGKKCFLIHSDSLHSMHYLPGMITIDPPCLAVTPHGQSCLTRAYIAARTDANDLDLVLESKKWMNSFKRRLRKETVGHVIGYRVDNPSGKHAYRDIRISEDASLFWKSGGLLVQDIYETERPVIYEPLMDSSY